MSLQCSTIVTDTTSDKRKTIKLQHVGGGGISVVTAF